MTLARLVSFAWLQLRRAPAGTAWTVWGLSAACAALLTTLAIADAALSRAALFVGPVSGASRIKVVAEAPSLSDWALGGFGGSLTPAGLDERALRRLAAIPGVATALPVRTMPVAVTARGGGAVLGREVEVDVLIEALPEALADVAGFAAPLSAQAPVPVLVHPQLLALYNAGVAPSLGTPSLPPNALVGLSATLLLGRGRLAGRWPVPTPFSASVVVVGSSALAAPLGLSVPESVALSWWQRSGAAGERPPIRAVWLILRAPEARAQVAAAVGRMGLTLDEGADQALRSLAVAERAAQGLAVAIFLLVGLSSLQLQISQATQRAGQWQRLVMLGASRRQIRLLAVGAALCTTLTSLGLGAILSLGLCRAAVAAATHVCRPLGFDVVALGPKVTWHTSHLAWAGTAAGLSAAAAAAWVAGRRPSRA